MYQWLWQREMKGTTLNRPRTFFTAIVTGKEGVKETDQDTGWRREWGIEGKSVSLGYPSSKAQAH